VVVTDQVGRLTEATAGAPRRRPALTGFAALSDPPPPDSKALLAQLRSMGVHTVTVTGDAAPTAPAVAAASRLERSLCPPGTIPGWIEPEGFSVYAGAFPEDKFGGPDSRLEAL